MSDNAGAFFEEQARRTRARLEREAAPDTGGHELTTADDSGNGTALDDIAGHIDEAHRLCLASWNEGIAHAIECGRLLIEAKKQTQHGQWLPWLQANCKFSERTAHGYMRVAREDPQRVADLTLRGALKSLAEPSEKKPKQPSRRPKPSTILPSPAQPTQTGLRDSGGNDPIIVSFESVAAPPPSPSKATTAPSTIVQRMMALWTEATPKDRDTFLESIGATP